MSVLVEKILLEHAGVPMLINSYVDEIGDYFKKTNFESTGHIFNFTPKPDFPLKQVLLNFVFKVDSDADENEFEGSVDLLSLKKDEKGNMSVSISVDITSPTERYNKNEITIGIKSVLEHELTHVYEDFKRKRKTPVGLAGSNDNFSAISAMNILKNNNLPPELSNFLFLMYAAASFEVSARVAQVYPFVKGVADPNKREAIIKKTMPWNIAERLAAFNFETFDKNFSSQVSMQSIIHNIPTKQIFLNYFKSMEDILKNMSNEFSLIVFEKLNVPEEDKVQVEKVLSSVSSHAGKILNKTPMAFFKYWERVFNKAGQKSKAKLLKIAYRPDF